MLSESLDVYNLKFLSPLNSNQGVGQLNVPCVACITLWERKVTELTGKCLLAFHRGIRIKIQLSHL